MPDISTVSVNSDSWKLAPFNAEPLPLMPAKPENSSILLEGPFESDYSLAIVNRGLAYGLLDAAPASSCTSVTILGLRGSQMPFWTSISAQRRFLPAAPSVSRRQPNCGINILRTSIRCTVR